MLVLIGCPPSDEMKRNGAAKDLSNEPQRRRVAPDGILITAFAGGAAGVTGGGRIMEAGTMKIPEKCARCGSKNLERGRLNAQVGVSFRPARLKFLVLSTGRVPVQADMCMDCGAVALTADPAEVKELIY